MLWNNYRMLVSCSMVGDVLVIWIQSNMATPLSKTMHASCDIRSYIMHLTCA